MKIIEFKQENYIAETSELLQALALRHIMLQEGRLDEAGIWDTVKGTVGGVMRGIKSADDAVNKLGSLAQRTKPVEAFDTKVDEVIATIKDRLGSKAPKAVAAAERYAEWAKKNPIKQGLIIGALTAIAALASGPGAAAAAGFILRAANEYMKGEKASTAVGKGIKTAALGAGLSWLAGTSIDALKGAFEAAEPVLQKLPIENMTHIRQTVRSNGAVIFSINQTFPRDVAAQIKTLTDEAYKNLSNPDKAASLYTKAQMLMNDPEIKQRVVDTFARNDAAIAKNKELQSLYDAARIAVRERNNSVAEFAAMLKTAANGIIQGTAASGVTGQAADAAKSTAGAAVDKAKGVVDKVKGFVPSKTYRVLNRQIKTLDISDQQKLAQYLQQKLATAS